MLAPHKTKTHGAAPAKARGALKFVEVKKAQKPKRVLRVQDAKKKAVEIPKIQDSTGC